MTKTKECIAIARAVPGVIVWTNSFQPTIPGEYCFNFSVGPHKFMVQKVRAGRQFDYRFVSWVKEDVFFTYFDDLLQYLRKTYGPYQCSH